jgi:hypothetical protein
LFCFVNLADLSAVEDETEVWIGICFHWERREFVNNSRERERDKGGEGERDEEEEGRGGRKREIEIEKESERERADF